MKKKTNDQKRVLVIAFFIFITILLVTRYTVLADSENKNNEHSNGNPNNSSYRQPRDSWQNTSGTGVPTGTNTVDTGSTNTVTTQYTNPTPTAIVTPDTPTSTPAVAPATPIVTQQNLSNESAPPPSYVYPTIYKTQEEFNYSQAQIPPTENQPSNVYVPPPVTYPGTTTQTPRTTTTRPQTPTQTTQPAGMRGAIEATPTEAEYRFDNQGRTATAVTATPIPQPQYAQSPEEHGLIDNINQNITDFLEVNKIKGTVGQQIKTAFQNQTKTQAELLTELEKLDRQNMLLKLIFGRDPKTLASVLKSVNSTKDNIAQLQNLKKQLTSKWDIENLNIILYVMEKQATKFDQRLVVENKLPSVADMIRSWFKG